MNDPTLVTPILGFAFGILAGTAFLERSWAMAAGAVSVAFVIAFQLFGAFQ